MRVSIWLFLSFGFPSWEFLSVQKQFVAHKPWSFVSVLMFHLTQQSDLASQVYHGSSTNRPIANVCCFVNCQL